MNKHIAFQIALAQRASDMGKFWKLFPYEQEESDELGDLLKYAQDTRAIKYTFPYRLKDECIRNAIQGIRHNPESGFKFRVTNDEEKRAKFIVYFDFRVNGKRMQVSFHSFDKALACFVKGSPSGHWDRKGSRAACIALLKSFGD